MYYTCTTHRVVFEHVGHVIGGDEGVVDGHHLDVLAFEAGTHHEAPDATETVDADLDLPVVRGGRHRLVAKRSLGGGDGTASVSSPGFLVFFLVFFLGVSRR